MSNIKSIEVIKKCYDMEAGTVLTRESSNESFGYTEEVVGEHTKKSFSILLGESHIDKENFKAVEWFEEKPLTNREKIQRLNEELEKSYATYDDLIKNILDHRAAMEVALNKSIYSVGGIDNVSSTVYANAIHLLDKLIAGQKVRNINE